MKKETRIIYDAISAILVILSILGIADILNLFDKGYEDTGESHLLAGAVLAIIVFNYVVSLFEFLKGFKEHLTKVDKEAKQ